MNFPKWMLPAMAACLVVLSVAQSVQIMRLTTGRNEAQKQLRAAEQKIAGLEQSNALISLHLAVLDPMDLAYVNAKVLVAWDSNQHQGSIVLKNFPLTPAGRDYQLWVLDPNAPSPLSAGVVKGARPFEVASCSVALPGFALTLEPTGGSAVPTMPLLFAVAPAK